MQTLDPAGEWLRLSKHYRQLNDEELVLLAAQASELTEVAQQVLAQEISSRRLTTPPSVEPGGPGSQERQPYSLGDAESPYAEDRELVDLCTVWSAADGLKLQRLLDTAGIPFFIGPEKATGVDAVTSNFADGLSVQVMRIAKTGALTLFQHYFPTDEPPELQSDEPDNFAIHCPKCHSTDVVFEDLDQPSEMSAEKISPKFTWTCDSCGHTWEDEGVATEN